MPQCNECGCVLKYNGVCDNCKKKLAKRKRQTGEAAICCYCGNSKKRSKMFVFNAKTKEQYKQAWCFECWQKHTMKQSSVKIEKKFNCPKEAKYYWAIEEYYLKPLFYGDQPDYEAISRFHDTLAPLEKKVA